MENHPVLEKIDQFIREAEQLGYGEVELVIKTHDYVSKWVDLKAQKPRSKSRAKSIKKRIMVKS